MVINVVEFFVILGFTLYTEKLVILVLVIINIERLLYDLVNLLVIFFIIFFIVLIHDFPDMLFLATLFMIIVHYNHRLVKEVLLLYEDHFLGIWWLLSYY